MRTPWLVLPALLVGCAHATGTPTTSRPPQPLSSAALDALGRCRIDPHECTDAVFLAPLDTFDAACDAGVPRSCVVANLARQARPLLDHERVRLRNSMRRRCGLGDITACAFSSSEGLDLGVEDTKALELAIETTTYRSKKELRTIQAPKTAEEACAAGFWSVCEAIARAKVREAAEVGPEEAVEAADAALDRELQRLCGAGSMSRCRSALMRAKKDDLWATATRARLEAACLGGDDVRCSGLIEPTPPVCERLHDICIRGACPPAFTERCVPPGDFRLATEPLVRRALLARAERWGANPVTREGQPPDYGDAIALIDAYAKGLDDVPPAPDRAYSHAMNLCLGRERVPAACERLPALKVAFEARAPSSARRGIALVISGSVASVLPAPLAEELTRVIRSDVRALAGLRGEALVEGSSFDGIVTRLGAGTCDSDCVNAIDGAVSPKGLMVINARMIEEHGRSFPVVELRTHALHRKFPIPSSAGLEGPAEGMIEEYRTRFFPELVHSSAFGDLEDPVRRFTRWVAAIQAPFDRRKVERGLDSIRIDIAESDDQAPGYVSEETGEVDSERLMGFVRERIERAAKESFVEGDPYTYFLGSEGGAVSRDGKSNSDPWRATRVVPAQDVVPSARVPASVASTGCPVTGGTPGVTLQDGHFRTLILAAANVDEDAAFDCWTTATFERKTADGRTIRPAEAYQEQADVPPADEAAAKRAKDGVMRLQFAAILLTLSDAHAPSSIQDLLARGRPRGWVLPDDVPECEGLRLDSASPDSFDLHCPGFGDEHSVTRLAKTSLGVRWTVNAGRIHELAEDLTALETALLKRAPGERPHE